MDELEMSAMMCRGGCGGECEEGGGGGGTSVSDERSGGWSWRDAHAAEQTVGYASIYTYILPFRILLIIVIIVIVISIRSSMTRSNVYPKLTIALHDDLSTRLEYQLLWDTSSERTFELGELAVVACVLVLLVFGSWIG